MNAFHTSNKKLQQQIADLEKEVLRIEKFDMQLRIKALEVNLQIEPVEIVDSKGSNSYYKQRYGIGQLNNTCKGQPFGEKISLPVARKIMGLLLQEKIDQRQAYIAQLKKNRELEEQLQHPENQTYSRHEGLYPHAQQNQNMLL